MDRYYIDVFSKHGFRGAEDDVKRILFHFDAYLCCRASQKMWYRRSMREWEAYIDPIDWENPERARDAFVTIIKGKRAYFYRIMDGAMVDTFPSAFRGAIHAKLLFLISSGVPAEDWKTELEAATSGFRKTWYQRVRSEIIDEYIDNYQDIYVLLDKSSKITLAQSQDDFSQFFHMMYGILERLLEREDGIPPRGRFVASTAPEQQVAQPQNGGNGKSEAAESKPISRPSTVGDAPTQRKRVRSAGSVFLSSKLQTIQFQCFIESILSHAQAEKCAWRTLLEKDWPQFFPLIPYSADIERQVIAMLGLNDEGQGRRISSIRRYFKSLGVALEYGGIENIRSESYLRSILLNRAAATTIAHLDPQKVAEISVQEVIEDTIDLLAQTGYVSNTKEADDLDDMMSLYMDREILSATAIRAMKPFYELYRVGFSEIKNYFNKRNHFAQNVNERMEQLETAVSRARYDVLRSFVMEMDRGSFGYRLGEMYRFAMGYDVKTAEEAAQMLQVFFNQLYNMNVKPIHTAEIGEILSPNGELYQSSVPMYDDRGEGPHRLLYPGWTVQGTKVALPVYEIERKRENV